MPSSEASLFSKKGDVSYFKKSQEVGFQQPAPLLLSQSFNPLVRFVTPTEMMQELLLRIVLVGNVFLDPSRAVGASTASDVHAKLIEDHRNISLVGETSKSRLVAGTCKDIFGKVVDRFTTITIQLDSGDYIMVNTLWSKCLANQYVYQIGPYGETRQATSVLRVLKDIVDDTNLIESQKLLFTTITECAKQGRTVTKDDLYKINPKLKSLSEEQFNLRRGRLLAAVYLFYYLEITRRPKYEDSLGYKYGSLGKEETVLCCEVVLDAWTKVLTLLQKGALTLEAVFAKDALYGLPTGKYLRKQDDQPLLEKIKRINELYMKTEYPREVASATSSGLVAITSMEESHQRLLGCTTPYVVKPAPTLPATPKA